MTSQNTLIFKNKDKIQTQVVRNLIRLILDWVQTEVMPCSLMQICRRSRGMYCFHLQGRRIGKSIRMLCMCAYSACSACLKPDDGSSEFLRNISKRLPEFTKSWKIIFFKVTTVRASNLTLYKHIYVIIDEWFMWHLSIQFILLERYPQVLTWVLYSSWNAFPCTENVLWTRNMRPLTKCMILTNSMQPNP
jgi:hypothetical protein